MDHYFSCILSCFLMCVFLIFHSFLHALLYVCVFLLAPINNNNNKFPSFFISKFSCEKMFLESRHLVAGYCVRK